MTVFGLSLGAVAIAFGAGLVVGWFVLKRPAIVEKIWNSLFGG